MRHISQSGHFEAPIEEVFRLTTDFKRYPEWNVSYAEIKEISGPVDQVGTKVHAVMRFLGRNIEGWGEIVEAEPPRLLKIQGQGTEGSLLTTLYRMTPAGVGTDFQLEIDYELPAGIVGAVANKLFVEKAVERDLRHSVENFKALVEAQVPVLA